MRSVVLTSESMTTGHPDKLCDQISDALVDACLSSDPEGAAVAECALASGVVFLSVRHRRALQFDPSAVARRVMAEAGYDGAPGVERLTVMLDQVAEPDLPGPTMGDSARARHMSTAFGYACDQTPERLPYAIWAAHRLSARLDAVRSSGEASWIGPDAQAQVAVRFDDRRPVAIAGVALTYVAIAAPPDRDADAALRRLVIDPVFADAPVRPDARTRLILRATPPPGGPSAHAGLTGRKTADDCYGAFARHSSSALSGKDPGRIERVSAYAARQAALSVVAAGLAVECEVQLCYAPGDAGPLSLAVESFRSGALPDDEIARRLADEIDFRMGAMVERLEMWRAPAARAGRFYRDFAAHGHFGRRDLDPPWERVIALD